MTCLPLGLRSANTGTRAPIRVKSSISSGTSAACAMASRCRTALVEPPSAVTTVIAFSNARTVMMSRGRRLREIRWATAAPASWQSRFLSSPTAVCALELGRLMPSASMAEAIVLAVYMPPHEPGPGMAQRSMSASSPSSMVPAACCPTASKTLTMSRFLPRRQPGRIVPP